MPHPTDVHVGKRVREARVLRNLTQEKLAELIGVSFQQVQKYEKGSNRIGSSRLWSICQALNMPVSFFFDGLIDDDGTPSADQNIKHRARTLRLASLIDSIPQDDLRNHVLGLIKACADTEVQSGRSI